MDANQIQNQNDELQTMNQEGQARKLAQFTNDVNAVRVTMFSTSAIGDMHQAWDMLWKNQLMRPTQHRTEVHETVAENLALTNWLQWME